MRDEYFQLLTRVLEWLTVGLMSSFGGVAAYIYQHVKNDRQWKLKTFAINIVLSFFIGNFVGSFIPEDFGFRDGILMLAGYSTFPLLAVLEIKGTNMITSFLERQMNQTPGTLNHIEPTKPTDKPDGF